MSPVNANYTHGVTQEFAAGMIKVLANPLWSKADSFISWLDRAEKRSNPLLSHKLKIGAGMKYQVDLDSPQSPVPIDRLSQGLSNRSYRTAGSYSC